MGPGDLMTQFAKLTSPTLKARGFKRDGRFFRRYTSEAIQVIYIQGSSANSQSGSDDGAWFYVNLYAYLPEFERLGGRSGEDLKPKHSAFNSRIGPAMWSTSSSRLQQTADQFLHCLDHDIEPWFQDRADLDTAPGAAEAQWPLGWLPMTIRECRGTAGVWWDRYETWLRDEPDGPDKERMRDDVERMLQSRP